MSIPANVLTEDAARRGGAARRADPDRGARPRVARVVPHRLPGAVMHDTPRPVFAISPAGRVTVACSEQLIQAQVVTVRIACEQMSGPLLEFLADSVDRACCLPARPGWERKATAHAEIFLQLAHAVGGPGLAGEPRSQARLIRDLMHGVGPAADGMVISSRRRLLDRLRAGEASGAALEMESHLEALLFMWRLAGQPAPRARS